MAYDNAYRDPEFREPKVKSRLLAEKFRDSIRDIRARESILDKGILDDTGKLKDSLVIIGIAKRATEVGDLLKTGPTVAMATPPEHDLKSMINKAVVTAVDQAVVAALQAPRQDRKAKGAWGNTTKNWRCHYCNTTSHQGGGWKACPDRRQNNPSWTPRRRSKPLAGKVDTQGGERPGDQDFPQIP